jgi:hypothetical protein
VITIILLISGLFLGLSPGSTGGLMTGQRMIGSNLRSLRAMALMNRGAFSTGVVYNARYRLLILDDPTDPENHLRQFVLAVGSVDPSAVSVGTDPSTVTSTSDPRYKWFAPDAPSSLPKGVFYIPTVASSDTVINNPPGLSSLAGRRSITGQLADTATSSAVDNPASPPWMMFAPVNQPTALTNMSTLGAKKWYYIELQSSGAVNHLGRVLIMLANASSRLDASGNMNLDLVSDAQFAALAVQPNGDIAYTTDPNELDLTALK